MLIERTGSTNFSIFVLFLLFLGQSSRKDFGRKKLVEEKVKDGIQIKQLNWFHFAYFLGNLFQLVKIADQEVFASISKNTGIFVPTEPKQQKLLQLDDQQLHCTSNHKENFNCEFVRMCCFS